MIDLFSFLESLPQEAVATAINDNGDIVGYGTFENNALRGFILHAVPEPATPLLSLLGVITLFRQRKKRERCIR